MNWISNDANPVFRSTHNLIWWLINSALFSSCLSNYNFQLWFTPSQSLWLFIISTIITNCFALLKRRRKKTSNKLLQIVHCLITKYWRLDFQAIAMHYWKWHQRLNKRTNLCLSLNWRSWLSSIFNFNSNSNFVSSQKITQTNHFDFFLETKNMKKSKETQLYKFILDA